MDKLTFWTFLVILVISLCHFQTSEAYCVCLSRHPQTHFCDSDFSAVVGVNILLQPNDNEVAYNVEVHEIFKATQNAQIALVEKAALLWSPSMEAMCGRLNLNPGEAYIVNGKIMDGKLYITLCDFVRPWSKLTPLQREGFQQFYQRGCACPISDTKRRHRGALRPADWCLWESSPGLSLCQERHGICTPFSDGCSWTRSSDYDECLAEHCRKVLKLFPMSDCI